MTNSLGLRQRFEQAWRVATIAGTVCVLGALLPDASSLDRHAEEGLRRIVSTPFDEANAIEILSDENSAVGSEPYVSRVSRTGDVWRLRQWHATGGWANFGLTVIGGRAFWASLDGVPALHGSDCASCHANGPRALLGKLRAGSPEALRRFNDDVANFGVVKPYYAEHARRSNTTPLPVAGCTMCHNDVDRSRLTRENAGTIRFRLDVGTMPPSHPADAELRRQVGAWFQGR